MLDLSAPNGSPSVIEEPALSCHPKSRPYQGLIDTMPVNVVEEARHKNHVMDKDHQAGKSGVRESDEFKPSTTGQFMEEEGRAFGW
jgi:hypothetical protein